MKVYEYETLDRPDRHCREGMAVEIGQDDLRDTFWGAFGSDRHKLTDAEVATATFLFDTDDFELLDTQRDSSHVWRTYAREDLQRITSQHRLQAVHYIRIGATPDLATMIQNARDKLAAKESDLRSATNSVEWAQQDLDELLAGA